MALTLEQANIQKHKMSYDDLGIASRDDLVKKAEDKNKAYVYYHELIYLLTDSEPLDKDALEEVIYCLHDLLNDYRLTKEVTLTVDRIQDHLPFKEKKPMRKVDFTNDYFHPLFSSAYDIYWAGYFFDLVIDHLTNRDSLDVLGLFQALEGLAFNLDCPKPEIEDLTIARSSFKICGTVSKDQIKSLV